MQEKEKEIKKYPYLAYSRNIMENFAMIGYQEKYIKKVISNQKNKNQIRPPTILFSATSNTDYAKVDNQLIINQIYPENPTLIPVNKNSTINEEQQTSNIISSFCYDSIDGTQKLFYICYAYKFYEKYVYQNEEYYIPKAFCIVSQYYFFTFFEYICKNLHILMKNLFLLILHYLNFFSYYQ